VANINPHLGVGAGNWRSKTVDSTVRVDQVIETANKGNLRTDAARKASAAAGEQAQAVVAQQVGAVDQAWYDAVVSQSRVGADRNRRSLWQDAAGQRGPAQGWRRGTRRCDQAPARNAAGPE
jgi:hypothetical protein